MNPRPPLCAQIGMLHGVIVGFMFGLLQQGECCQTTTAAQLAWIALLLAGLAALTSAFILTVICRYTLGSVLFAVLVNAVLVAFAVVFILQAIGASVASVLIGIVLGTVIGLIVGWILCMLCDERSFVPAKGG